MADPSERDENDRAKKSGGGSRRGLSWGQWLWEWAKSLSIAFLLFLFIRTFIVEAFRIPTGSMKNTLLIGDFLLVSKVAYGADIPGTDMELPALDKPERGDIVVFVPPHAPNKHYVKRLVGLPGDTLKMRDKVLYVNGEPQPEPYVQDDPYKTPNLFTPRMMWQCEYRLPSAPEPCHPTRDNWGPIVVPEGKYFVLGDNRDDSADSRYWGFVDADAIKGRPLFVYYSYDSRAMKPFPWITEIRWGRIGKTFGAFD